MERRQTPQPDVAQAEQLETHVETHEVIDGPNMAELRSYMAEYGEMMVESPRLLGVVRSLQVLMDGCPKDPTEETAPDFLAEAKYLVSATLAKESETESEDEEAEKVTEAEEDSDTQEAKKKVI